MSARGFTLIEVLVALVIVAFGMGAVMAALSASADNIAALREKTLAEWVALNQVADARLNLNVPRPGVTEGDVKGFGSGDWHWRQDVIAVEAIPGMIEIAVRVKRLKPGEQPSSTTTPSQKTPAHASSGSSSGFSSGSPSSFFSSGSSSGSGSSSSSAFGSSGLGQFTGSSGAVMQSIGATQLPVSDREQNWVTTVIGFRGDAIAPASGEQPDWSCAGPLCNSSSSSSGASASSSGSNLSSPNTGTSASSSGINLGAPSSGTSSGSSGGTSLIGTSSGA